MNDWLAMFKGQRVPKEAVQAFLSEHGVHVEERVLGAPDEHAQIHSDARSARELGAERGRFERQELSPEDEAEYVQLRDEARRSRALA